MRVVVAFVGQPLALEAYLPLAYPEAYREVVPRPEVPLVAVEVRAASK